MGFEVLLPSTFGVVGAGFDSRNAFIAARVFLTDGSFDISVEVAVVVEVDDIVTSLASADDGFRVEKGMSTIIYTTEPACFVQDRTSREARY